MDTRYELKTGSSREQAAHKALNQLGIFDTLSAFAPTLVGTIPIDIDIPGSDLDVICHADDLDVFQLVVRNAYGEMPDFQVNQKLIDGIPSIVARFPFEGFLIEIFGQGLPVETQRAYRHMMIEGRLLDLFGEEARNNIREIKLSGLKTEPAFGQYFKLEGDPYLALLELEKLSDIEILELLS